MPYDVASPWAAAASAMGGYLDAKSKKKQQDVENQQNTQRLADEEANAQATQADAAARLAEQRATNQATQAYRMEQLKNQLSTQTREQRQFNIEHGLDADTGAQKPLSALPKNLTQVSPGNKGKGPKPGSVEALKAEYAHASTLADFYATGQGGDVNDQRVKDLVAHWSAMTTQAASDLRAAQTQEAEADRAAKAQAAALALHGTPNWGDLNLPHGGRGRTPSAQEQYFIEHGYSPPTFSEANPQTKPQSPNQTNSFTASRVMLWSSQHPDATDDQIRAAFPNVNKSIMDTVLGTGAAPATPGGGGATKKTVSLKAAMALPNNKGKTAQQVQADITAHGYAVAP